MRLQQPMRKVACSEFGCEWFMFGQEGEDGGFAFTHPQGVACGDFSRCRPCASPIVLNGRKRLCGACQPCRIGTSNCPCAQRTHFMPITEQLPTRLSMVTEQGGRLLGESEWKDRVSEGLYAQDFIRTRGI